MLALAAVAAVPLALGGCYNRAADLAELARHHATATGRIVVLECARGRWWYEFEVQGQRRRGPVHEAPACDARRLGQQVTVYYNPALPQVHRAVAPAQAYAQERGFHMPEWLWFCLGALALPLSAWMALKRGARRS
jgi:hypothetical protein